MRKLTDSSKLEKSGWKYTVELEEGIRGYMGGIHLTLIFNRLNSE
jgi:hypothetical protein